MRFSLRRLLPGLAIIGTERIPYIIQTDPLADVMPVRVRALLVLLLVRRICPTAEDLLQAEVQAAAVLLVQRGRKKINIRPAVAVIPLKPGLAAMIKPGAIGIRRAQAQVIVHLLNVGTPIQISARVNRSALAVVQTALAAGHINAVQTVGLILIVYAHVKADMRKILLANALKNASAETKPLKLYNQIVAPAIVSLVQAACFPAPK